MQEKERERVKRRERVTFSTPGMAGKTKLEPPNRLGHRRVRRRRRRRRTGVRAEEEEKRGS